MRCDICGKEVHENAMVDCASCGAILCPACDNGGFCAICIGAGMLD